MAIQRLSAIWKKLMDWREKPCRRPTCRRALPRPPKQRLVVVLEGGLVDSIVSDGEMDLDVAVIEYDSTGGFEEDEDVIDVDRGNGKFVRAFARLDCATKAGIDVEGIFEQLQSSARMEID